MSREPPHEETTRADGRPGRGLLLEATLRLLVARIALLLIPSGRLAARLGRRDEESPRELDGPSATIAAAVRGAIRRTSRWVPWRSDCLIQAMAARSMLERRGVPTTLYLLVRRSETTGKLEAHACLRAGGVLVTGATDPKGFEPIASFG
ncbi:MAG TPA: lasso peptide biosynthesis B2 protein [Planctomycetota bacterium]|nr:lasso peptide biosynthesis B2 protein [Planctomycetota bacterium]